LGKLLFGYHAALAVSAGITLYSEEEILRRICPMNGKEEFWMNNGGGEGRYKFKKAPPKNRRGFSILSFGLA